VKPRPQHPDDDLPDTWIKSSVKSSHHPGGRRAFPALRALLGLYVLGGVAPLALRVGPRQFLWAALSIVSLTVWVTLGWFWDPVRAMMTSARLPILPFLVGLLFVHCVGALAWARAINRTVRDERFRPDQMPRVFKNPWVATVLGVAAPGFGLAVAGRATRAAFALWNAAQVAFSVLVLAHASLLWTWNTRSGVDALPKPFVETFFVICAAVAAVGGLLWVGGALDGARLQGSGNEGWKAMRHLASGDAAALALMLALLGAVTTIRPAQLAHDLDAFSGWLRVSGARLIPLALESAASTLDPGRPVYAMRVAELHTELGHTSRAQVIQNRLRQNWEAYAQVLLQQSAATPSLQPARPIQPAGDLVPQQPELKSLTSQAAVSPGTP
jgi:hypothetical protein